MMLSPVGLMNFSNSCHLNVVIQSLFNCRKFNDFLLTLNPFPVHLYPICYVYLLMYTAFMNRQISTLNPLLKEFHRLLVCSRIQQDAHETWLQVLDKLHQELIKNQISQWYFSGQMIHIMQCKMCNKISPNVEKFEHIILPIGHNEITTVTQALNGYFMQEIVENGRCLHCNECNQSSKIWHKYLRSIPVYLILILNRFDLLTKKNNKFIDYELVLDVSKYFFPLLKMERVSNTYSLKSIINHQGNFSNGHYYCYQKYHNEYYMCNDMNITKIQEINDRVKQNTYILVYELNE